MLFRNADMFLKEFPDLAWLKQATEAGFADKKGWNNQPLPQKGWPTVVLNVKSKDIFRDNIKGPYSYFSNRAGASQVQADKKKVMVNSDFFFLTNRHQRYTLAIDKQSEAETFNIHFGEQWAEETAAVLQEKTIALLDNPSAAREIHFFNKLYPKDSFVKQIEAEILRTPNDPLHRAELLSRLLAHLICLQVKVREVPSSLESLKASTRQEIMQRLWNTVDYMYAYYHHPISLDDLAVISCLSKFHFLRLFQQAFRQTPHQFITALRLEKAKELLSRKNAEVKSISSRLGFENASSFSRLFRQHTGMYPSQFISKK